jgi:hypothetical protein
MLTRRQTLNIVAGAAAFTTGPAISRANPLFGFFARMIFSRAAGRSASEFIVRTTTSALVRPRAVRTLQNITARRADDATDRMREGGFQRVVSEVGGDFISDISSDLVWDILDGDPQIALVHSQSEVRDADFGGSSCLGIVHSNPGSDHVIFLENPEMMIMNAFQDLVERHYGVGSDAVLGMTIPTGLIEQGNFTFDEGSTIVEGRSSSDKIIRVRDGALHLSTHNMRDGRLERRYDTDTDVRLSIRFEPYAGSRFGVSLLYVDLELDQEMRNIIREEAIGQLGDWLGYVPYDIFIGS